MKISELSEMATTKDWDKWKPTAEGINSLPGKVREYVHCLETLCDPAGIISENTLLRDEMAMFKEALIKKEFENIERDCDRKVNICGNDECRHRRRIIAGLDGCLCRVDNCFKIRRE